MAIGNALALVVAQAESMTLPAGRSSTAADAAIKLAGNVEYRGIEALPASNTTKRRSEKQNGNWKRSRKTGKQQQQWNGQPKNALVRAAWLESRRTRAVIT